MEEGPISKRLKEQMKSEIKMTTLLSHWRERKAHISEQVSAPTKNKKKQIATSLGLKLNRLMSRSERHVCKVERSTLVIPQYVQVSIARLLFRTTMRVNLLCTQSLGNSIFFITRGRNKGGKDTMAATRKGPLYPNALNTKLPMKGLEASPSVMPIWKILCKSSIRSLLASESRANPIKIRTAALPPWKNYATAPKITKTWSFGMMGRNASNRIALSWHIAAIVNIQTRPQAGITHRSVRRAQITLERAFIAKTRLFQRGLRALFLISAGKKGPRVIQQKKTEKPVYVKMTGSIYYIYCDNQ